MGKRKPTVKRKYLPKNYVQQVALTLASQGITLKTTQISDIIRGKNTNVDLGIRVWTAVRKLEKSTAKKKRSLAVLQQPTRKA